ncbi:hypothetical protein LTR62_000022 [Meristemomyces frigidus]|uniref:Heterokaryon incompatibility domain-containing protein n=1 Tax=Meristemomyces frigidus TaxID=1508187 RepID=A0AAN7YSU2_9PEZI|nr:hypothetical protein LTR62_000022 [Meristemomyces frigidus]
MVSTSPRLRDSLDYEDPEELDPRLAGSLGSLRLPTDEYDHLEWPRLQDEHRSWSWSPEPGAGRRRRRQKTTDRLLEQAVPFQYRTVADGDVFRVILLQSGVKSQRIQCMLTWENSRTPKQDYRCLSYCWETTIRDSAILVDGCRFAVTRNLHKALLNLRSPTTDLRIWIDQICINQEDHEERSYQVSIMKHIFTQAKEVIIWLGDEDDKSGKLCEYARKMPRGEHVIKDSPKSALNKIMGQRQLQDAIQKLLARKWFTRVWVIPEVALARFNTVAIGNERISWDNMVRLIRDTPLAVATGFDKQSTILGNVRQRIAIISQMVASQRENLYHTDITQLLILAKSSEATDLRDKVYAFDGVTLLRTQIDYRDHPDYKRSVERVYLNMAHHYIDTITSEDSYTRWHGLSEERCTQQLMSILYSAGRLHQHLDLPSWTPDWTFAWYQAPLWCKADSNMTAFAGRDAWSAGIRSEFRAGGDKLGAFELVDDGSGRRRLRVSVIFVDTIARLPQTMPGGKTHAAFYSYGRVSLTTKTGLHGLATSGVEAGDRVAIIPGGDVPVVLRPYHEAEDDADTFILLCECLIQMESVMNGNYIRSHRDQAESIVLS